MEELINVNTEEEAFIVTKQYLNIVLEGQEPKRININKFKKKKSIKLFDTESDNKNLVIKFIEAYNRKYILYYNSKGNICITTKLNEIYKIRQKIRCRITKKNIIFYGIISNILNKEDRFCNVFVNGRKCTEIKRLFKMKKLKHIAYFKIPLSLVEKLENIHNDIKIGINEELSIPLRTRRKYKGMNYYSKKKVNDNYILVRSVSNGENIKITKIKMQDEYKKINYFKNFIASHMYKFVRKNKILMFEKESKRAVESGYYMFEKLMEYKKNHKIKNVPYFIISDENSELYEKLKEKYGKYIIKKYSFKHYMYIYACKYFIASELSNHVINPRIYIKNINKVISEKPLIFLQHGIMFAKPVDNPAALGFHKGKTGINVYKNIISSDLEATQFFKMGYNEEDLIKCGLTKFDVSYMNPNADKIMYMPTYRYWEEVMINGDNDSIKETTYYKSFMRVIRAFEENGLIEKLIVSCHPKFAECLTKAAPEYEKIIENDINRGIENSRIFITDYSSAAFDAHYRGAYIIYNWEERDYLIENYHAIPPIDETNCDGVPTFSMEQLISEVKRATNNDYIMDEIYQERYKKINEFSDGKNAERLIKELRYLKII